MGCYNVAEAVAEFINTGDVRKCPSLQIRGRDLPPIILTSGSDSEDNSQYLPGDSTLLHSSGNLDKSESMDLAPNSRRWFINNVNFTSKLGIQNPMSFEECNAFFFAKKQFFIGYVGFVGYITSKYHLARPHTRFENTPR